MAGTLETVFVRKRKRPVGSGVWAAYVLGRDVDGLWLHTPAGSLYRGEDGHKVGFCEAAMDANGAGRPTVQLIPTDGWWIATWYPPAAELAITIDICTPPTLNGSEWTYLDLELDPYLTADGGILTDDWDEFLEACAAGLIPHHEEEAARTATKHIEHALTQRAEPFGTAGLQRLETARAMKLPPLTDLTAAPVFPNGTSPIS